ncbi:MAG: hypothetical protein AAB343_03935 [Patescibacteria group bacterium]
MTQKKSALDELFGSPLRARLMRFFLLNSETVLTEDELRKRTSASAVTLKRELQLLLKVGFIKRGVKEIEVTQPAPKKKIKVRAKTVRRIPGFIISESFAFFNEFRGLFLSVIPAARAAISKDVRKLGKVKVVIVSGIFLNVSGSPVDMLIVGENIKTKKLEGILQRFERELGKDLVYAVMPTQEFEYRFGMSDRFVDTLLSGPHETLIDQLNIIQHRVAAKSLPV